EHERVRRERAQWEGKQETDVVGGCRTRPEPLQRRRDEADAEEVLGQPKRGRSRPENRRVPPVFRQRQRMRVPPQDPGILGRITHTAPVGLSDGTSVATRARSASWVAPKKMASLSSSRRPTESCVILSPTSFKNRWSSTPIADARHSAFTPILSRRDGGCWILNAHFSAASPRTSD